MLYEEIKRKNIEAMKSRDTVARAIYSVLISKIDLLRITKREKNEELTDADCVSIIQKTLKELEDEQNNYQLVNNVDKVQAIKLQREYASAFLPKMLEEKEILEIINSLEDKSIPNVMKYFKVNYLGKCDMSLVSKLAKSFSN